MTRITAPYAARSGLGLSSGGVLQRFQGRTLVAMMLIAAAAACDDSHPTVPVATVNTLTFTRSDQSRIVFPSASKLTVWCGPWEEGTIPRQTLHVVFAGTGGAAPGWQLRAVVADVRIGVPLTFPNTFVFDQPKNADLFILDPPNELSSSIQQSTGSITFQQLTCATGGTVQFSVAAVIASELNGGAPVAVAGGLTAAVGEAPR